MKTMIKTFMLRIIKKMGIMIKTSEAENHQKDGRDDRDVDVEDHHEAPPASLHLGRDKAQRCQMLTTACYQTFCHSFYMINNF